MAAERNNDAVKQTRIAVHHWTNLKKKSLTSVTRELLSNVKVYSFLFFSFSNLV